MPTGEIIYPLNVVKDRIDRYLKNNSKQVFVVNVQNKADLKELVNHYLLGNHSFVWLSDTRFCRDDELHSESKLIDELQTTEKTVFVRGLSAYCMLKGKASLHQTLGEILRWRIKGHVIFCTYQCLDALKGIATTDPRLLSKIYSIESNSIEPRPRLVFLKDAKFYREKTCYTGIQSLYQALEESSESEIRIVTQKHKLSFPDSLLEIEELSSPYKIGCDIDATTLQISEALGSEDEWSFAVDLLAARGSWKTILSETFGNEYALDKAFLNTGMDWSDPLKLWLLWIGIRLFGSGENKYLGLAAERATSLDSFRTALFDELLNHGPSDHDFTSLWEERKQLLKGFSSASTRITSYCALASAKERLFLEYLTDQTQCEKEAIFKYLDQYGNDIPKEKILNTLSRVYPDLAAYLSDYRFKQEFLTPYFRDYKYQKVINKIFPEFMKAVENQATERDYNKYLQPRCSFLEQIDTSNAQTYFLDAVGVEYLGYIVAVCSRLNLFTRVTVCRCELPSLTTINKEFFEILSTEKHPIIPFDSIDKIKHQGAEGFDYSREDKRLPFHLIRELKLLSDLLSNVKDKLAEGAYKKAIFVSDHGASRLAVIHNTENIHEMASSGMHSGRCCPKSELDEPPPFATDAGDFWALANYDRFKGGRKASVEVHGGATLEEIVVPIVEISIHEEKPEIHLSTPEGPFTPGTIPEIPFSFKKKASVKIVSTKPLDNVTLEINGFSYEAVAVSGSTYVVQEMKDIRKAGEYEVTVLSDGNIMKSGLKLRLVKEGAKENSIL